MVRSWVLFILKRSELLFHSSLFILIICYINGCATRQCKRKSNSTFNKEHNSNVSYEESITNHPCYRTCEYPAKPRICEYEFITEWANSMSGYCFDCPFNPDHCKLKNCLPIDGHPRSVVVTNGKTPGPSIQVCRGDTIRVKVVNQLLDHGGLSIHWHGPHQVGTNWMDGVSMITQCPIPHATSFVYEFLAQPAGTHWWHAHSGFYRVDGIYGTLVVRKAKEEEKIADLYDFDLAEHVMIVSDWTPYVGLETYLAQTTSSTLPPITQSTILINGKGRGRKFTDDEGNVFYTPRSVFHVVSGFSYRFRIISSAIGACNIQVSIDGHLMLMIATDGSEVKPVPVNSFIIASGERYDFVINASAVPASYLIHMTGLSTGCSYTGNALLCYHEAPCGEPTSKPLPPPPPHLLFSSFPKEHYINTMFTYDVLNLFDTYALEEIYDDIETVNSTHYVTFSFFRKTVYEKGTTGNNFSVNIPKLNNVGFLFPSTPVLLQRPNDICEPHLNNTLMEECNITDCYCTHILKLKLGEVVELVIPNFSRNLALDHPVHIHGQAVRIVGMGVFDGMPRTLQDVKQLDEEGKLRRISSREAVIKDTVIVPQNGYVITRWKTTNPGIWFFHCHIENHLESGMSMVIQVGEDDDIATPPEDFPTCGPWQSRS